MSNTHKQLEVWFSFLRDRAAETGTPQFNRMAGFAYGYARAMLEVGHEELAQEKVKWLIAESEQFKRHPTYPGREADASVAPVV
jgi:hypothetical protein